MLGGSRLMRARWSWLRESSSLASSGSDDVGAEIALEAGSSWRGYWMKVSVSVMVTGGLARCRFQDLNGVKAFFPAGCEE